MTNEFEVDNSPGNADQDPSFAQHHIFIHQEAEDKSVTWGSAINMAIDLAIDDINSKKINGWITIRSDHNKARVTYGQEILRIEDDYSSFAADIYMEALGLEAKLEDYDKDKKIVRSPVIPHLTDLMGCAVRYFPDIGEKILYINGKWNSVHAKNGLLNRNYSTFYDLLENGATPQEAALATPTGKAAAHWGYSVPQMGYYGLTRNAVDQQGEIRVNVAFHKPRTS